MSKEPNAKGETEVKGEEVLDPGHTIIYKRPRINREPMKKVYIGEEGSRYHKN